MSSIKEKDRKMNELVANGQILEAFEEFVAEDVVMDDVAEDDGPWEGKDVNREREKEFVNFIDEVHEVALHHEAVEGNVSFSEWTFHVTFKNGDEMNRRQIERRIWEDGEATEVFFF
jgi:hypothetical protein